MTSETAEEGTTEEELRWLVATAGAILHEQGLVDYLGHCSARVPGTDRVVIKPKHSLRTTNPAMVGPNEMIVIDLDGNVIDGSESPPTELFIHTEIYRRRPDVLAVVHTHQSEATLLGVVGADLLPLLHVPAVLTEGGISAWSSPVLVSNSQLGQELAQALGERALCHLRGHGIVSVARDIQQATVVAIALEQLAAANLRVLQTGLEPRVITSEELNELRRQAASISGRWAYYEQLLSERYSERVELAKRSVIYMRGVADYYARFDVSDLVVVVTGGTEGIGFGIAEAFGNGGASVVVASRSEEKVQRAEALLSDAGAQSLGIVADVRDPDAVDSLFAAVAKRFGRLDVLVNSVGGSFGDSYGRGPLLALGVEDFMECYRSNVIASVLCSKAAVPMMTATGGGSIIHLSSGAGLSATPFRMGAYGASKAALNNLTRTMAMEFAPTVRVNAICPGHTDTPRTTPGRTPEHTEKAKQNSASGRIGTPADIASVVCFLASPAGSWVNAQVFGVDGGRRGHL